MTPDLSRQVDALNSVIGWTGHPYRLRVPDDEGCSRVEVLDPRDGRVLRVVTTRQMSEMYAQVQVTIRSFVAGPE